MNKPSLVMPPIADFLGSGVVRALQEKAIARQCRGHENAPSPDSLDSSEGQVSTEHGAPIADKAAPASGKLSRRVSPKRAATSKPSSSAPAYPCAAARPAAAGLCNPADKVTSQQSSAQSPIRDKIVRLVDKQCELDANSHKAQLSFVPSWAVSASFPYRDLGEASVWSRSTKKHALVLQSGYFRDAQDPSKFVPLGLPYGVYARYIFIWMATAIQAALSKNKFSEHPLDDKDLRVLDLARPYAGKSLMEFLFPPGATPSYGPRGTLTATVRQLQRLAALKVAMTLNPHDSTWQSKQMLLMDEASLSTLMELQGAAALQARVVISERFFETIRDSCVPLNWELVYALGKSPQAIDLYAWLSHQCYITNHFRRSPMAVSWGDLYEHFGGESTTYKFAEIFKKNLLSIRLLWPALDKGCSLDSNGLVLAPGVELTVATSTGARMSNRLNAA